MKGFHDNLAGGATLISESQMKEVGTELNTSIKAKMEAKAAKVKAEGLAFLENNKKQPGVVTLPSGLQYKSSPKAPAPMPAPMTK